MPNYKLTYFDLRGRAEIHRQLFALAGVPYVDKRIKPEDWPTLKPTTPFGQLPLLEVDGKPIPQSMAIARFLAKRFGFAGANDLEEAQIDALVDLLNDYMTEQKHFFGVLVGRVPGDKAAATKELFEPARDKYFPLVIEKYLKKSKSGFLVGSKVSWVDLHLAGHITTYQQLIPGAFDKYPEVIAHRDRVEALPAIKEWIAKRPKSSY
ncbi:unnamed protein product, partial [Mesorhabditis belari]|uniref:glutathione transferase n=1 Tax=Mesorhabditis belari TaxID=2138241 RepID=A0AAF3EKD5_9BILA